MVDAVASLAVRGSLVFSVSIEVAEVL